MKEKRKEMKERMKGREREGRKGERNEYDLRRGLTQKYVMGYVLLSAS